MARKASVCLTVIIVLCLYSTPGRAAPADGFVGRSGTQFTLNGAVFPVAGTNNHYLSWASQAEVDAVLNDAVAMNANVIRTFFGPVIGSLDGKTVPTIWHSQTSANKSLNTNGVYYLYWDSSTNQMAWNDGPDGLQRMDYVLAKAHDLKLKVLLSFLDFWEYTGGVQQMRAWYGNEDRYDFFFRDPRTRKNYIDWVTHVLNHVNTITGIMYKDDPTIFGWDLMNEPQTTSIALIQSWIAEMSAYIKAVDPNHLIGSGSEGFYGGLAGSDPYTELAIPTLDFGTWHGYPDHMGISPTQIPDLIKTHCQTAARQQKPVLFEEFGYRASDPNQPDIYQNWTDALNANPQCAGWLYWRLTSKLDSGVYPEDNSDQFDIHADGSLVSNVLKAAALKFQQRDGIPGGEKQPGATATPVPGIPIIAPLDSQPVSATLVPQGTPGQTYFVAFPKTMKLDGELKQWEPFPQIRLASGPSPSGNPAEDGALVFSAAADMDNLYLLFVATDVNIISGAHGQDFWNEDSIEIYLNTTGDLTLSSYVPGIADINIPTVNLGRPPDEPMISTQQTLRAGTRAYVFRTTTGYAAQVAIPLQNTLWTIKPQHGGVLGFQFQLNGASRTDRDTILSWSAKDINNQSYKNPSVFAQLIFFSPGEAIPTPIP